MELVNLVVKDLDVRFPNGTFMLSNINVTFEPGKISCILGPNGAGKTTLIRAILGLQHKEKGFIYSGSKNLSKLGHVEKAKLMGYVPQNRFKGLGLEVWEYILLGRRPHMSYRTGDIDIKIVDSILNRLDLLHLAHRSISSLSGGEAQKVSIARALAQQANIIILDEPTSALDIKHQLIVLDSIKSLAYNDQHTIVMVLHDLSLAAKYADHILLLKQGNIFAQGPPETVLTSQIIREVYGVEADVTLESGTIHVIVHNPV